MTLKFTREQIAEVFAHLINQTFEGTSNENSLLAARFRPFRFENKWDGKQTIRVPIQAAPDKLDLYIYMKNSDTIRALLEGSLEIKVLGATVHVQSRHTREQIEKSLDLDSAEQLRQAMTAAQLQPTYRSSRA